MALADNPQGQNVYMNKNLLSLWSFAESFSHLKLTISISQKNACVSNFDIVAKYVKDNSELSLDKL